MTVGADTSALVKLGLVREEPESEALRGFCVVEPSTSPHRG